MDQWGATTYIYIYKYIHRYLGQGPFPWNKLGKLPYKAA